METTQWSCPEDDCGGREWMILGDENTPEIVVFVCTTCHTESALLRITKIEHLSTHTRNPKAMN